MAVSTGNDGLWADGHSNASTDSSPAAENESRDCDEADYVERVSSAFLSLRGTGLFLSPRDMETILEWWETGVPIGTVIRGMTRGAERLHAQNRPIRTLARLKRHVKAAQRQRATRFRTTEPDFVSTNTGAEPASDTRQKNGKISALIDEQLRGLDALATRPDDVPSTLNQAIEKARGELETIRNKAPARSIDWTAGAILDAGRAFYQNVLAGLSSDEQNALKAQARASLRGLTATMSEEALTSTLEEIMISLLRERLGLFIPAEVLALWDP